MKNRPGRGSINEVIAGSAPFVVMIFIMIGLLVAFPDLALIFSKYVQQEGMTMLAGFRWVKVRESRTCM